MDFTPYVELDPTADAVYVWLSDAESARTRNLGDWRMVDYDAAGRVVGAEILGVSAGVNLSGVLESDTVSRLLEQHALRVHV